MLPHELVRRLEAEPPHSILVDTDLGGDIENATCRAARQSAQRPTVLVTTSELQRVPAMLKNGCHSVLLKPFPLNLLITRVSRPRNGSSRLRRRGTNIAWPCVCCSRCGAANAISFDAAAYRCCWFACLACDNV
jgi:DNA-binding response OmpR family regulator